MGVFSIFVCVFLCVISVFVVIVLSELEFFATCYMEPSGCCDVLQYVVCDLSVRSLCLLFFVYVLFLLGGRFLFLLLVFVFGLFYGCVLCVAFSVEACNLLQRVTWTPRVVATSCNTLWVLSLFFLDVYCLLCVI